MIRLQWRGAASARSPSHLQGVITASFLAHHRHRFLSASSSVQSLPQQDIDSIEGKSSTSAIQREPETSTTASAGATVSSGGKQKKTQAELDEELKQKMEGLAGDGGASGVEYEDGRPVAMKRSVRENMFRYI
ncbi:hypothetical protein VTI74DRAFT_9342 [Chaetomium olivicolor]